MKRPLVHSGEDTWAPSGIAFIEKGPWSGKILVATLRGEKLLSLSLQDDGKKVERIEVFFENEFGRMREVIEAKDGSIYLTTSNRDGRGNPDSTDDKIIKLIPKIGG
jgi:glucose/arabinose dehydrogenase